MSHFSLFIILSSLLALPAASSNLQQPLHADSGASPPWDALDSQVEGRLFPGTPFASSCFAEYGAGHQDTNSTACTAVQASYVDEVSRTNAFGAYINSQWETCQATGEQCLLDYTDPNNPAPTQLPNSSCGMGSLSNYFIDVEKPEDVTAAFSFARTTKIPLVIKNTGHDYKGRSSAPGSLAVWTHHLKDITYDPEFVPEGCIQSSPGVTVGAGVQWAEAYAFADAHNITLVGGSDRTVGVSGGWLQGGGHGALSNTMGMGVDRVLQFKVVTPDGKYRTANACQNKDLFFALRGGGGGTFGVVLESTILASPPVTLQVVIVAFKESNMTLSKSLWSVLVDNGLTWASEGWGGFATAQTAIYINPKLTKDEAATSMAPLTTFGKQLQNSGVEGAELVVMEFPSWGGFFNSFSSAHVADVGSSLALASRLINKSNFQTDASRTELVSGLAAAEKAAPGIIILVSPPTSFPAEPGATSITEAWRDSIYHVTLVSQWNWNATMAEKKGNYTLVSEAIENLRRITPDAAYSNEADVYEPNHEVAFWGSNYPKLLSIKQKYDPDHLLDCWQCVGWNPTSSQYSCYL